MLVIINLNYLVQIKTQHSSFYQNDGTVSEFLPSPQQKKPVAFPNTKRLACKQNRNPTKTSTLFRPNTENHQGRDTGHKKVIHGAFSSNPHFINQPWGGGDPSRKSGAILKQRTSGKQHESSGKNSRTAGIWIEWEGKFRIQSWYSKTVHRSCWSLVRGLCLKIKVGKKLCKECGRWCSF